LAETGNEVRLPEDFYSVTEESGERSGGWSKLTSPRGTSAISSLKETATFPAEPSQEAAITAALTDPGLLSAYEEMERGGDRENSGAKSEISSSPKKSVSESRGEQEEKVLLRLLMDGYERDVRPVRNASRPILIQVGITLTQIFDMVCNTHFLRFLQFLIPYLDLSIWRLSFVIIFDLRPSFVRTFMGGLIPKLV